LHEFWRCLLALSKLDGLGAAGCDRVRKLTLMPLVDSAIACDSEPVRQFGAIGTIAI
jgi:hypothetical protein